MVEPQNDSPGIRQRAVSRLPGGANALTLVSGQRQLQWGHPGPCSMDFCLLEVKRRLAFRGCTATAAQPERPWGAVGSVQSQVRTRALKGRGESGSESVRGWALSRAPRGHARARCCSSAGDLLQESGEAPRPNSGVDVDMTE